MKIRHTIFMIAAVATLLTSCKSPRQIAYFQDVNPGDEVLLTAQVPIRLAPHDIISIIVSTSDARLDALFNLPVAQNRIGNNTTGSSSSSVSSTGYIQPYTIDKAGDITFPVLGKLHIAGMTREEVAEYIRRELMSRDLAKNPIVTVEYQNLSVTVLGEVGHPGRVNISREDFSILDAISAAGDLSIYGQRNNIKVWRQENGKQHMYQVNLNEGKELVQSPVYYLKQNDVIYVEPNDTKKMNSTPNGNTWSTPGFWISTISSLLSLASMVIVLTKK